MARKTSIKVGDKFGKLIVTEDLGLREGKNGRRTRFFRCRCGCGNEREVMGSNLKSGNTRSCGCSYSEDPLYDKMFDIDDAYERLRVAIVLDAVDNVRTAKEHIAEISSGKRKLKRPDLAIEKDKASIDEALRFFRSDWFKTLCDIDAETLIRRIGG